MTVIYIDILIVLNLTVDYLVLFGTARLYGVKFVRSKGLLASLVGAFYSLVIFLDIQVLVFVLSNITISVLMLVITFGKRKTKDFIGLLGIFYICGFLFSGFMMLVNFAVHSDSFFLKGGVVYFELSPAETVFSGTAAFLVTEILRRIFRRGEPEGGCTVKLFYDGKYAVLKGFVDTGNNLSEPLTGTPVAVTSPKSIEKILPENSIVNHEERTVYDKIRFYLVPCKTVSGTVLISAFRPESVIILNENGEFSAEEIMIGISDFAPENTLIMGKNIILKKIKNCSSEV